MLRLIRHERADAGAAPSDHAHLTLTLRFEQRCRSRLRVVLDQGPEAGLFLPRGTLLAAGDWLGAETGEWVRVEAAAEPLSEVVSDDPWQLARACYHLGNRHVALQIAPGRACYLHDHVLDEMVRGLGLTVRAIEAPFIPEGGAYSGGGHDHAHHHHHE